MHNIPRVLYSGNICDCYIGRVIEIREVEYNYVDVYCKLELVKELIKSDYRPLSLYKGEFIEHEYENGYEISSKLHEPPIGQLIQVLKVGGGYGCSIYVNLLDSIEDVVPIPGYYQELVAARTDTYQI